MAVRARRMVDRVPVRMVGLARIVRLAVRARPVPYKERMK